jgi:GNAT superfamily N-acetyltransferase
MLASDSVPGRRYVRAVSPVRAISPERQFRQAERSPGPCLLLCNILRATLKIIKSIMIASQLRGGAGIRSAAHCRACIDPAHANPPAVVLVTAAASGNSPFRSWPSPPPGAQRGAGNTAAARIGEVPSPVVTDSSWIIRLATPEDGTFMGDMLVAAVNWSSEWKKKSRERIFSTPKIAHYIAGWPRDSDLGVIAESNGQRVGAAWLRFLPASDPGYGFVASDVPEMTVGVAASWRGQGVGRALLRAVAYQARLTGIGQISLSVERKNHAQKLYISEGYQIVDSSDADSDTMVKDLQIGGTRPSR